MTGVAHDLVRRYPHMTWPQIVHEMQLRREREARRQARRRVRELPPPAGEESK